MNYRKYIPHLFIVTLAIILTISCANSYNNQSDEKDKTTIKKKSKKKLEKKSENNIIDQLEALNDLYKSGVLTKEEFEKGKKKILN